MTFENTIVWADIPVTDLDRAMKFYGAVLQHEFIKVEGMDGIALLAPPPGFDPSSFEGSPRSASTWRSSPTTSRAVTAAPST